MIHSRLLVISWWSNSLALACLTRLAARTRGRSLGVIQVGKSRAQKERMRNLLPPGVIELIYPEDLPAEHSRVLEWVVRRECRRKEGIWCIDHDALFEADLEAWLTEADARLTASGWALCLPETGRRQAITSPAFWVSPARLPEDTPSFDPVPFQPGPLAQRPDLYRHDGRLALPTQDTLVAARDVLAARGLAGTYPLSTGAPGGLDPLPAHSHFGGLSLLTGPVPPQLNGWAREMLTRLARFFESCPREWLEDEDPELIRRWRELNALPRETEADIPFERFPRGDLPLGISRRKLWSSLAAEAAVFSGTRQGGQAFRLAELGTWSDEELARLIPEIVAGCQISVREGSVWAQPPNAASPVELFALDSAALAVFNRMNGRTTLAEVVRSLAAIQGWDAAHSMAYVRGLFLYLVSAGVARPTEMSADPM